MATSNVVYIENGQGGMIRSPECRFEGGFWIASHRKPSHCRTPLEEGLWWYLLRSANWKMGHLTDSFVEVHRGETYQVLTSLAPEFGYTYKQLRGILDRWADRGAIERRPATPGTGRKNGHKEGIGPRKVGIGAKHPGTIIKLLNYEAYQRWLQEAQDTGRANPGAIGGPESNTSTQVPKNSDSESVLDSGESDSSSQANRPTASSNDSSVVVANAPTGQQSGVERDGAGKGHNPSPAAEPKRRATRLPKGWVPSEKLRSFAVEQGVPRNEVRRTFDEFTDYWRAKAGQAAAKLDWDATWRNWVRREGQRCREKEARRRRYEEPEQPRFVGLT